MTKDLIMADILVPFDHSENSFVALQQSLLLARKSGAKVEVFHVINLMITSDYPMAWTDSDEQAIKESIETKVDSAKKLLSIEDVDVSIVIQKGVRVVDEVLLRADESNTIFIVMGTHGVTGLIDKVLGTNSLDVISNSKWPVLLIPPHWKPIEIEELVVAADLNEFISITESVHHLKSFFKIPVRAVQLTSIIDTIDHKDKDIDGIPYKYIPTNIELTLAENLRNYTRSLNNSILVMYTHPRKFFQKLLGVSFTEETAKVIEIPLLSVKKSDK